MKDEVKDRFTRIYKNYDFFNHFFSMDIDKKWRREAANDAIIGKDEYSLLDAGTGTGDFAIAIFDTAAKNGKKINIEATDFTPEMLEVAKEKVKRKSISSINFKVDDALRMDYLEESFDVVTSAFCLRSFGERNPIFLKEMWRVMKHGGKFVMLDMALPDDKKQRKVFSVYSHFIKFLGYFTDREAYHWLVKSINQFSKPDFVDQAKAAGFRNVTIKSLSSGVAFVVTGEK